jgi:hypothetical protein
MTTRYRVEGVRGRARERARATKESEEHMDHGARFIIKDIKEVERESEMGIGGAFI